MSSVTQSPLRQAALTRGTHRNYTAAVRRFVSWSRGKNLNILLPRDLDCVVAVYVDELYERGRGKQEATNLLYGILFILPYCRTHMHETALRLRGWNNLRLTRSYPPMLWEIAVLVAFTLLRHGEVAAGAATLLAFDAYLRVNEFCSLRVVDVSLVNDARMGSSSISSRMALRLLHTKTGRNQFVQVRRDAVAAVIAKLIEGRSGSELVFGGLSDSRYRMLLGRTCKSLGLSSCSFVPHSLRHGGAVLDLLQGMSIENVMYRGRWRKAESARTYLQSGRALLLSVSISPRAMETGRLLSSQLSSNWFTLLAHFSSTSN
jgi:integrase